MSRAIPLVSSSNAISKWSGFRPVASRRRAGIADASHGQQCELRKSNKWALLCQFIDGHFPCGEYGNPVVAVHVVVPGGVLPQKLAVECATADDLDGGIIQRVAGSQMAVLHEGQCLS